jgi:CubicO group peptidase (beta-lactamase class C family)
MENVHGQWDPRFEKLPKMLQSYIDSGEELGASLAVDIDGESVIDIWGGHENIERSRTWEHDTITNLFSSTKPITALAALLLVDRHALDVDAKVSKYWPEFAVNGKADVKVRHILSHTSGVSGWDDQVSLEDICDCDGASRLLAAQSPWWEPGTASGYHSFTFGHLISQLVYRTTGKTLKEFIADEISGPVHSDFQIGVLEKDWPRISNLVGPPEQKDGPKLEANSVAEKTFMNPPPSVSFTQTATWRNAEIGAANGHGNARALVRILSIVTTGGHVKGKRFLSQDTTDLIFEEQARGNDLVVGIPLRFGIGFGIVGSGDTFVDDWMPSGRVCYWGGWGGSLVILDFDRKVTISYVMNKMSNVGLGNTAGKAYVKAIYDALEGDMT